MRRLLIALVGVGITAGAIFALTNVGSSLEVVSPRVEHVEVEKEVVVPELDKRVMESQEAARDEIKAKAQKAYDNAYEQAMKEVKLEVVAQYRKEVQEMETSLSKEVGAYWREEGNIIQLIKQTFPEHGYLFVQIARGESGLKQWHKDGRVVQGIIDPDDTGLFQINNRYWGAEAERLGLDYRNSLEDNVKMARHIFDTQGVTAWVYYNDHLASR